MSNQTMDYFEYIIMIQLVFAFSMTILLYALPSDTISYVSNFETDTNLDVGDVSQNIQSGVNSQMNLPLLDMGALVFYSGNIIIDLLLRVFLAIPEMFSILIGSVFMFIGIDSFLSGQLQILIWAVVSVVYVLGLLKFMVNIRSGVNVV